MHSFREKILLCLAVLATPSFRIRIGAPAVEINLLILYPQTAGAAADLSLGAALLTGGCPRVLGGP